MAHVDALSRHVGFIDALPLERELEFRQLRDPRIKEIANKLEFEDHDKFELIEGLVYRKEGDRSRFVVPENMVLNIIRAYHDEMAYCGDEKTVQGIRANYWFPSIRKKVNDHISNCLTCISANASTHTREGNIQIVEETKEPLNTLYVDHFGLLQETEDGYKHILVVVDAFTRFTWLYPTKTTSSKEAIRHLKSLFNVFGNVKNLVSDRGTAFTSAEFTLFLKSLDIYHRQVAVAAPWANGRVERVNRFLKSSLKKLVNEPQQWKSRLGIAQYVINNTVHAAIKASPSKLLLGYELRNQVDAKMIETINTLAGITFNVTTRDENRDVAVEATSALANYNKTYYDRMHKKPTEYQPGDYVMIRDTQAKPSENQT